MSEGIETAVNCYSAGERAWMEATQRWRGRIFSPLLDLLTRLGMRPTHLTLLSTTSGLTACVLFMLCKPAAFVMLGLHVLFDGLDGPLARHTGMASRSGTFTDTMSDQLVLTGFTLTLMSAGVLSILPGGLYIFLYAVVVAFAMVRNAMAMPYSWLFRPRFFVFSWCVVDAYLLPGTLDAVFWGSCAVLALKAGSGFVKIRRSI